MTAEELFFLANSLALLSWVALVVLPRHTWVSDVVAGICVPIVLAATYVALIAVHWAGSAGGFATLADVALLFASPWLLLAGWIHYLCFDLLIGCWEVRDSRNRGIPHLLVVPCLILTFLFGPAGWLAYRGLIAVRARSRLSK